MTDVVIRGGLVLAPASGAASAADILIQGGVIRALLARGAAVPEGMPEVDATDRLLLPGLINAHTHAHGGLGRGLAGDLWTLERLLNGNPAINAARSVDDLKLSATLTAAELALKGCTAAFDLALELPAPTVEGIHAVAAAYQDVGIRAVVAPMISDLTLYQALPGLMSALPDAARVQAAAVKLPDAAALLTTCRDAIRAWPVDRDRVRPGIGPAIPLHCTDALLTGCRDLARDWDLPIQTHLAESQTQAAAAGRRYGHSLVGHLDRLGLLGPPLSVAHAIWLDPADLDRIAGAGVTVVHNPASNLRLGSGVAPVRALLDRGAAVAIGTDATNTSDGQNMFEAMRLAAFLSRPGAAPERWLSARDALRLAAEGGARALGWSDRIGRLAPGFQADILFLDLRSLTYVPLRDPALQLVFGESGAALDRVMVAGRVIVDQGRLTTLDLPRLRRDAEAAARRLDPWVEPRLAAARALDPVLGRYCAGLVSPAASASF